MSVESLSLPATFKASVASPPVETAPATISPMVVMQNGHIFFHLPGGEASLLSHLYRVDGQGGVISTSG